MTQENAWHTLTGEEGISRLETTEKGLASSEAERRLQQYGPNELEEEKRRSKLALLAGHLRNPLIAILFLAVIVCDV